MELNVNGVNGICICNPPQIYYGEIGNRVFQNSLIVRHICSFSISADLPSLRLINHTFQYEATKKSQTENHLVLENASDMKKFIQLMKKREARKLTPFLFTSIEVNLDISAASLRIFGESVGKHIHRYSLVKLKWKKKDCAEAFGRKAAVLLSFSPQLAELTLKSDFELYLPNNYEISLEFPRLSVIEVVGLDSVLVTPTETQPLLDVIVSRARQLKQLKIPLEAEDLSLRITRLFDGGDQKPPSFNVEKLLKVGPHIRGFVKRLMNPRVKFTHIDISIPSSSDPNLQTMMQLVSPWLEIQSGILTNLSIGISLESPRFASFRVPRLPALKNLSLKFPSKNNFTSYSTRPFQPLTGNIFPVLETLLLDRYKQEYGLFYTCLMPSIRKLHLKSHAGTWLANPNWHVTFPCLRSLRVELNFSDKEDVCSTVTYILTHLTRLVSLNLETVFHAKVLSDWDDWDLLTGRAPRSVLNLNTSLVASSLESGGETGSSDTTTGHALSQLPSLGNMKALKTLRYTLWSPSTLKAISYMTRTGLLVSLQKLSLLSGSPQLYKKMPTGAELARHDRELLRYHKEVETR